MKKGAQNLNYTLRKTSAVATENTVLFAFSLKKFKEISEQLL